MSIKKYIIILASIVTLNACEKNKDSQSIFKSLEDQFNVSDQAGKFVINPQYNIARSFSEGLAAIRIGEQKTSSWGYIDKTGKMIVNPQFIEVGNFSEGLAAVILSTEGSTNYVYGFIDRKGEIKISPQFTPERIMNYFFILSDFREGIAMVRVGDSLTGKVGFIRR